MKIVAKYSFSWYELDQELEIGLAHDYYFHNYTDKMVFYNGLPDSNGNKMLRCRIVSIRHPELGEIKAIDTKGLDYTISLQDGTILKIEAEETPGLIYDSKFEVSSWDFEVEIELV